MADVGELAQTLNEAVEAAKEGVQFIDMGDTKRKEVIAMYAGFVTAFEGVIGMAGNIMTHLSTTTEYAQVGGDKLLEGTHILETLGTDDSMIDAAVLHYRTAARRACGEGSMLDSVAAQIAGLGEVIADFQRTKDFMDNLTLLVNDEGHVENIRMHVDCGTNLAVQYAEAIGVTPPVV